MVYSLAVNSKILTEIMVKGNSNEKGDLIRLAMQFLEARNPGLAFDPESWNFVRGKEFEGNLAEIQDSFLNPSKVNNNPSLLSQLGHIATHGMFNMEFAQQTKNSVNSILRLRSSANCLIRRYLIRQLIGHLIRH